MDRLDLAYPKVTGAALTELLKIRAALLAESAPAQRRPKARRAPTAK
jgi:hypothetical protein